MSGVRATLKARQQSLISSSSSLRCYAVPATLVKREADPQLNGYPQLPNVSRQTLPPKGWWDIQMRRNMGDTMHEEEELYSMWGPDAPNIPPSTALYHFSIAVLGFVGFGFLCKYALVPERPAIPREYPFDGLVKELGGLEANKQRTESLEDEE
ncbi:hypothetical protein EW146_g7747 [Bondarzewia mesenterica]|uniref:NADH dehydrogenase [ubiquinone] 1 beta subcomplex subunit 8, mitochondrial n=1 Tax=Bondarzewia mesenterica TaxID=1095465 RepID=A0A4S4LJW5_9AGAM|nr:hypothetical protein EW146_g7747 [Bondarzewia mesenterica]